MHRVKARRSSNAASRQSLSNAYVNRNNNHNNNYYSCRSRGNSLANEYRRVWNGIITLYTTRTAASDERMIKHNTIYRVNILSRATNIDSVEYNVSCTKLTLIIITMTDLTRIFFYEAAEQVNDFFSLKLINVNRIWQVRLANPPLKFKF